MTLDGADERQEKGSDRGKEVEESDGGTYAIIRCKSEPAAASHRPKLEKAHTKPKLKKAHTFKQTIMIIPKAREEQSSRRSNESSDGSGRSSKTSSEASCSETSSNGSSNSDGEEHTDVTATFSAPAKIVAATGPSAQDERAVSRSGPSAQDDRPVYYIYWFIFD